MTIHAKYFQRQVKLEIDMSNLGAARFASLVTKEIEQDRGGETKGTNRRWYNRKTGGDVGRQVDYYLSK